jgi:hypothetical protein
MAIVLVVVGVVGLAGAALAMAAEAPPKPNLTQRRFLPSVSRAELLPTATPTPEPVRSRAPVVSLYLGSAGISQSFQIEPRDTSYEGDREVLQDPTYPGDIAWYSRFGHPSDPASNTLFAAHINYFGFGNGPFAYLQNAQVDSALYVTLADGTQYVYDVRSVEVIPVSTLQSGGMQDVVYPPLESHVGRITLISCGGDFVPYANGSGAGEYTSRVVVVAERYIP